jgi:RNA polymerase sigma factor (sigma-70 family)
MRSDGDLLDVASRDLRFLSDDELVRVLILHRLREDHSRAKEAWDHLVENVYDRVRTKVGVWRWPGKDVRIPQDEVDDVTHLALIRLGGIMGNFESETLPQFRAFAMTTTAHTCMDWARSDMKRDMHHAGNLDDRREDDEGSHARFDTDLARIAEERAEREAEQVEIQEAVERAIAKIPSEDQRVVLEMTTKGYETDEIAGRLGTSADNVYQLRRRGLKKLKEVLGDGLH